jgi:hypothetical protein
MAIARKARSFLKCSSKGNNLPDYLCLILVAQLHWPMKSLRVSMDS